MEIFIKVESKDEKGATQTTPLHNYDNYSRGTAQK